MTGLVPIVNQPFLYVNGLQLSWTSTTSVTVQSGQCRDSTDTFDMFLSATTLLNFSINGLNGLDTGTLSGSQDYYIYIIADPTGLRPTGLLASLSSTPFLPAGYGLIRRIGWVLSSSGTLVQFVQSGTGSGRYYQYSNQISVLSSGTSTTFATVNLAPALPPFPGNLAVLLNASYTPAVAGNVAYFRTTGTTVILPNPSVVISGVVAAKAQAFPPFRMIAAISSGNLSIDYQVTSSDSLNLYVMGYEDNL